MLILSAPRFVCLSNIRLSKRPWNSIIPIQKNFSLLQTTVSLEKSYSHSLFVLCIERLKMRTVLLRESCWESKTPWHLNRLIKGRFALQLVPSSLVASHAFLSWEHATPVKAVSVWAIPFSTFSLSADVNNQRYYRSFHHKYFIFSWRQTGITWSN